MNRYCRYILILLTLSFTMSANAKSKFTADIKMRNGHEYSGVEFTTPKSWDKEVAVKRRKIENQRGFYRPHRLLADKISRQPTDNMLAHLRLNRQQNRRI